ncbi:MAG: hypothetical protein ABI780_14615 [Ardenticatenales bacterium]
MDDDDTNCGRAKQRNRAPGVRRPPAASLFALLAAGALLGGCGKGSAVDEHGLVIDGGAAATTPPGSLPPAAGSAGRADETENVPAALRELPAVQAALADFADSLTSDAEPARIVAVREVTWPDSALGCPQPDEMYTQALVPGYQVRLTAGLTTADYHTNRGHAGAIVVRRCAQNALVPPGADPAVLETIRRDLADRLPPGLDIALDHSGPSFATNLACPGTPEPTAGAAFSSGVSTLPLAVTDVVFRVGSDEHLYRVWQTRFVYCGLVSSLPPGDGTPTVATE